MNPAASDITCYLGTGGPHPGLRLLDGNTGQTRSVLDTPSGHSVYCLDVALRLNRLALGTRGGHAWACRLTDDGRPIEGDSSNAIMVGAPVLSVCVLSGDRLMTSDTAGRCLLWDLSDPAPVPQALQSNGDPVCSLHRLPDDGVLGLGVEGDVLHWRWPCEALRLVGRGPRPAKLLGLTRWAHWRARDVTVYGAANGSLVLVNMDREDLQILPAHDGACLIIERDQQGLITIGHRDGRLLLWDSQAATSEQVGKVPAGLTAGTPLVGPVANLVLVDERGEAVVFRQDEQGLHWQHSVRGVHHRVVAGPNIEEQDALLARRRQKEAERLCADALESIERGDGQHIDVSCRRLADIGYAHVAYGLEGHRARFEGDDLGELAAHHALYEGLPDEAGSLPALRRYAALLEEFSHAVGARAAHDRICHLDPGHRVPVHLSDIAMAEKPWIIETRQNLTQLIQAYDVLAEPITGRYVVNRLRPIRCGDSPIKPTQFADELENLARTPSANLLSSPSVVEPAVWVCPGNLHEAPAVVLAEGGRSDQAVLEFVVRLDHYATRTLTTPFVWLSVERPQNGPTAEDHNEKVARMLRSCVRQATFGSWIHDCNRLVIRALRRLAGNRFAETRPAEEGPHG